MLLAMFAIVSHFKTSNHVLASPLFRFLLFRANPLLIHLCYFVASSLAGFLLLKILPMRDRAASRPADLDLLFMSVSANTVTSLDTVEMEDFSNLQLATLTVLMAAAGKIFVSLLSLYFAMTRRSSSRTAKGIGGACEESAADHAELGNDGRFAFSPETAAAEEDDMEIRSVRRLFYVVEGYHLVVHVAGFLLILLYLGVVREAGGVLRSKGLNAPMFSIFTTVSSLANCGFIPTNENLVVFRTYSGLLLIFAAQVLVGNTMYASTLRAVIWALSKATRRPEYDYLLSKSGEVGFEHLVPARKSASLSLTVAALVAVQFLLFCSMEWSSPILSRLSPYEKIVGAVVMSVNSRYSGESIVDLSAVSPAILVLFIMMMYLPPYTCFLPGENNNAIDKAHEEENKKGKWRHLGFIFSPLGYVAIFTIIACITERRRISDDPLNFSILNIVFEIVSVYGTVGYSTGYSCKRRLPAAAAAECRDAAAECRDTAAGFAAKWSNAGKLLLIGAMLFGRMKKFSLGSGKSWHFL